MAFVSGTLCARCLAQFRGVLAPISLKFGELGVRSSGNVLTSVTSARIPARVIARHGSMHKNIYSALYDESSTKDFIYSLHPRERELLFKQMQKFEEKRLNSNGTETVAPPSSEQLRILAFHNALPFIGFGFLDNLLMIVCGEYIDSTLGITLGISTMAAAGLGNLISDVAGIGSASYVESLAMKLGVRTPELTPAQVDMAKTRWTSNLSKAFGVAFGCFIGMFPLLLFKEETEEEEKKEKT